jgi:hypothetical protein
MLPVELAGGFGEGELQVGRGGDGELARRSLVSAGGQEREQAGDGSGAFR